MIYSRDRYAQSKMKDLDVKSLRKWEQKQLAVIEERVAEVMQCT